MRLLPMLLTILLAWLGSTDAISPHRWLVNRPSPDDYLGTRPVAVADMMRARRSPQQDQVPSAIKGRVPLTKVQPFFPSLRKGEYICGNKICKLQPGEVPKGCHGICQYPL